MHVSPDQVMSTLEIEDGRQLAILDPLCFGPFEIGQVSGLMQNVAVLEKGEVVAWVAIKPPGKTSSHITQFVDGTPRLLHDFNGCIYELSCDLMSAKPCKKKRLRRGSV